MLAENSIIIDVYCLPHFWLNFNIYMARAKGLALVMFHHWTKHYGRFTFMQRQLGVQQC